MYRYRRQLNSERRRGVRNLTVLSAVCLAGVTLTGIWQFFAHESDPSWYSYVRGSDAQLLTRPSTRMAEIHGMFGDATALVALLGGAWFAYRVLFDVPWPAVWSLLVAHTETSPGEGERAVELDHAVPRAGDRRSRVG